MTAPGDQLPALLAQAVAGTGRQRIDAGIGLSRYAHEADAANALLLLLLDDENTAVTHEVALALLEREDGTGLRLIVSAVRRGDEQVRNWIVTAVTDNTQTSEAWTPFRRRLLALTAGDDCEAAAGAAQLVDLIKQDAAAGFEPFE